MKRKKPWLAILLGSSLLTILAIDLYLLLSFEFPTKLIQEPFPSPSQIAEIEQETQQTPVTENGADEEDNPQYVEDEPDDPANDIQTFQDRTSMSARYQLPWNQIWRITLSSFEIVLECWFRNSQIHL